MKTSDTDRENKVLVTKDELNTRAKILFAAKQEFFAKGFLKANVRSIAQAVGLTTGAIYNQFKNKDSMFDALVGTVVKDFLLLIQGNSAWEYAQYNMKTTELSVITELSRRTFLKIIDFFYAHWDEMKLVMCCSNGSSYENIFDTAIRQKESEVIACLKSDNIRISKRTEFFIHVMVSTEVSNLKEIFDHNLTKAEAVHYITGINNYHCAGWKHFWLSQEEDTGTDGL